MNLNDQELEWARVTVGCRSCVRREVVDTENESDTEEEDEIEEEFYSMVTYNEMFGIYEQYCYDVATEQAGVDEKICGNGQLY